MNDAITDQSGQPLGPMFVHNLILVGKLIICYSLVNVHSNSCYF